VEVTTTFAIEMEEDFEAMMQHGEGRRCLGKSYMDESSCRREKINLTWRCTIVQAMMVGLDIQLLNTCMT
jgi:hypothetical protein